MRRGDEGLPFVPKGRRPPGTGDEGMKLVKSGAGMGDEGKPLKKKVPKKPPRRTK